MGRLDGKVAVVTGGANGIGRACCERFAEDGADVVVGDILDTSEVAAAVRSVGRSAVGLHVDVTNVSDNEALMEAALTEFGRLDVLVTAAGISRAGYRSGDIDRDRAHLAAQTEKGTDAASSFAELPLEEWHQVLDVNLTGTFLALQSAARRMLALGCRGSIITIASVAAKHPDAGTPPYCVAKAGVWMLTKQAAGNLGPAGIRVNAVGPGVIDTNMSAVLMENPEALDGWVSHLPLGRVGTPRDVANAVLFLASDEAAYITGEMLQPDGGFVTD